MQRVRQVQTQLESILGLERLPRPQDRVQVLAWGSLPLVWDMPRFGVVENSVSEHPRTGWQVTLAQTLQEEPAHILAWVVWREAFLSFLLPHLRQIPEVADLGLFAGLKHGGFSSYQIETLTAVWQQVSPPQHHVHYIYDAPYGFTLFDQVVDGEFLRQVVIWLNGFRASAVAPLTSTTYTAALEQWMLETHIPLTANEVRILSILAQTTHFKQTEIAQRLDMLPSALSPALTKLAQRHILRLYNFIDLPLIGLIPLEVILQVREPRDRSKWIGLFSTIPYAYSLNTIQQNWLVGRFLLPKNHVNDFQSWIETFKIKGELVSSSLFKVSEIIDHWNFDSYTPGIGWVDDFSFIMEKVRASLHEQTSQNTKHQALKHSYSYDSKHPEPFKLRTEDFIYFRRALDTVFTTDRVSPPLSQEIRDAGLSDSAYRRRVLKIEEQNISKLGRLWLLHIGLDTVVQLLLFEPKETITNFVHALSNFPYITGALYKKENARLRVFVPNLQAVEVLSFLQKLSGEFELDILIEAIPYWKAATGFQLPIKETNYDFDKGAWKWDKASLPKL